MQLYTNDKGNPIIPKCGNCVNWHKVNPKEKRNALGYCKLVKLHFAFTRKENLYGMTKDFYWCESHEHLNKETLLLNGYKEYESLEEAVSLISPKK
jgi:hypothetical protein